MTCKNLIERDDKCPFCGVRGTSYCMLPVADKFWVSEERCASYKEKETV